MYFYMLDMLATVPRMIQSTTLCLRALISTIIFQTSESHDSRENVLETNYMILKIYPAKIKIAFEYEYKIFLQILFNNFPPTQLIMS